MRTIAFVSPNLSPEVSPTEDAPLSRESILSDSNAPPPPSSPCVQSANTGDSDDDIKYIRTLPSSSSDARQMPALSLPVLPRSPVNDANDRQGVSQKVQCKQHVVNAPPGQTGIGAYPFLLHDEEHTPWEFSSHSGSLLLRARKCENRNLDERGLCKPCQALLSNTKFKNILARIENGVNENAPYKFHGLESLTKIVRKKERTIGSYRLRHTNDARKLVRAVGHEDTITLCRQVLPAMSSRKIPRLEAHGSRRLSRYVILALTFKAC